jgi:uncharacterized protein
MYRSVLSIGFRRHTMAGEVSYLEIGAKDAAISRVFFEKLFGWSFHPMGSDGEGWFQTPSIKAGVHGNDPEPQFSIFFDVPDLIAAIAQVKELGGQADEPSPDEPGFGKFCACHDPQGVRFGLHQLPKN